MTITKFALLAALSTTAFAQLPQSRVLTLDVAQMIAQETLSNCRTAGYKVTVLVADSMNAPKALMRDDGATASTTEVASSKATATCFLQSSLDLHNPAPGTTAPPATIPGTINAQGGVLIARRRNHRRCCRERRPWWR